jgi:hypothetical protein
MVCDGAGSAIRVLDLANVPASIDPCAVNECASDGQVSVRPLVAGAPCPMGDGAGLCDGAGTCVGCLVDADCAGAQICGAAHACMPPSCADGARNGAESDVDCGGGACARCGNGRHCTYDADCVSGLCHLSDHVCGAALCTDQRKDGDETDIDCGGSCPPCAASGECRADADCASKACYAGLPHRCLVDHCLDGHQNFDETDRDCGGSTCPGCLDFGKCKVDADCQSDHCDLSQGRHFCLTALCFDGARDQNETDVDCGGNLCVACALGQSCASWFDCASNACDGLSFTCVADHCADHRLDPGEVDVDCGGTCGATCAKGQNCMTSGDCAPGLTCSPWRECE